MPFESTAKKINTGHSFCLMIELDGTYGEGGGALVRTALALSALTGKPFRVTNIRAGRSQPGLKAQHLEAINALKQLCRAKTNDLSVGSRELQFTPGKIKRGIYDVDIGTAGSITLLLQALILPSLFAPGKVTLKVTGGTCGKWQASVDYLQNILLPHLERFVDKIELKIIRRGYYPKGNGKVQLEISPRFLFHTYESFENFQEDLQARCSKILLAGKGELLQVRGVVNCSSDLMEKEVAERIKISAENSLKEYSVPMTIRTEYASANSTGGEIVLWGISRVGENPFIVGGDALVERGKRSEDIGKEAATELISQLPSPVDEHLADMLIPFMGLLPGSEIFPPKITKHTHTNIYVTEQFLPVGFSVQDGRIRCLQRG